MFQVHGSTLRPMVYRTILIGLLFSLLSSPSSARVVELVLVVVNGEPYTLSNFRDYARTRMGREFLTGDIDQVGKEDQEVLEQFITEKLLAAEVKLVGIRVSEEEIEHYIGQIKEKNRISDQELQAALSREGVSMEKYRASIRAEIEKSEIINRQVRKRVNITSEDVERYYRANPMRYMIQERVRLRHILLGLPERASPEREKEVMAKVAEVRSRASAGEDFAELARSYTEGAGASAGGDIGWVSRGSLLGEIEEAAFNKLSLGEVSQPLRTSLGVHLIKLEAREPRRALPLSEVAGKIKEELYAKALEERFQKWLKSDLRRRHRVDVKLPGVVFRPEEEKKGTVDSLMASRRARSEESGFLSYLNPLSYIFRTTPIEGEDAQGELSGTNIVSLFGVPLFTSQSGDDVPEDVLAPMDGKNSGAQKSEESGGFFSSIWKTVNPFSSRP
jgi:parvulin-like peptidyl-prolyl isomerase